MVKVYLEPKADTLIFSACSSVHVSICIPRPSPHCRAPVGYNFEVKYIQNCNNSVLQFFGNCLSHLPWKLKMNSLWFLFFFLVLSFRARSAFVTRFNHFPLKMPAPVHNVPHVHLRLLTSIIYSASFLSLCSWWTVTTSSPIQMCSGSSWKRIRPSSLQCLNPVQPIQTSGVEWPPRYCADDWVYVTCFLRIYLTFCVWMLFFLNSAVNLLFFHRVTISAPLPTYLWGSLCARAVLQFPWSTPPSW